MANTDGAGDTSPPLLNGQMIEKDVSPGLLGDVGSLVADPADTSKTGKVMTWDGSRWVAKYVTGELAYVEFTSTKTATSSTETSAVTVVSAGALTFDGATKIRIEFFCPQLSVSDNTNGVVLTLFDGNTSTPLGQLHRQVSNSSGSVAGSGGAPHLVRELTPSAASHTYFVGILDAGAVTTTHAKANAGTGGTGALLPGFIRVVRV